MSMRAIEYLDGVAFHDLLVVALNAPGYPESARLLLPGSISPFDQEPHWSVVRAPARHVLHWLANWSDDTFPSRKKLRAVLCSLERGRELPAPVLARAGTGYRFARGAHTALMLTELGAPSMPLIVPSTSVGFLAGQGARRPLGAAQVVALHSSHWPIRLVRSADACRAPRPVARLESACADTHQTSAIEMRRPGRDGALLTSESNTPLA